MVNQIAIQLIVSLILLPIGALMLWICGYIFKEKINYGKAILVTLIAIVAGWILKPLGNISTLISSLLYIFLPKYFFNLKWGKGLLIGIVWFIFYLISATLVAIILAGILR